MRDETQEEKQCPICWEELSPTDSTVTLGCGHRFHYKCLAEWGKRNAHCPMCREPFQEEAPPTEEEERHEFYVDFASLNAQEDMYWWQAAAQGVALLSTSITIMRFMALLFPHTIHRLFHPQIQAGKQLQLHFATLRKHLGGHLPTLLLAACLCLHPLTSSAGSA